MSDYCPGCGVDFDIEEVCMCGTAFTDSLGKQIDRLERQLAEKDKEIAELKKKVSDLGWGQDRHCNGPGYLG